MSASVKLRDAIARSSCCARMRYASASVRTIGRPPRLLLCTLRQLADMTFGVVSAIHLAAVHAGPTSRAHVLHPVPAHENLSAGRSGHDTIGARLDRTECHD